MYSVRGWRSSNPAGASSSPGFPSNENSFVSSSLSSRICGEEEEVDGSEENDIAAPLPSEQITTGRQLSKPGVAKGTSAKDKRRMREKRRSTGVANLSGHEADALTTRNTSFNETPGVVDDDEEVLSTQNQPTTQNQPSTRNQLSTRDQPPVHSTSANTGQSIVCSAPANREEQGNLLSHASHADQNQTHNGSTTHHKSHDNRDHTTAAEEISIERLKIQDDSEKSKSTNVSVNRSSSCTSPPPPLSPDFAKNICARPFEAKKGILKAPVRPVVARKPEMPAAHSSARSLPASGQRSREETRLMSRISELETMLESERREKTLLEKYLSIRDSRIRELEFEIVTLNEDLDLADEDYLRLEEENRALGRALCQLSVE